jgi:nucleoid-associated protein YgaU
MKLTCPHCSHELNASGAATGAGLRCPVCRQEVAFAGASAAAEPHGETPPRMEREARTAPRARDSRFGIPGWTWLILCSTLLGLFAVPVAWYASRSIRGRLEGDEAQQALAAARTWLQEKTPGPSADLEQKLAAILRYAFVDDATKLQVRRAMLQVADRKAARDAVAAREEAAAALQAEKLDEAKKHLEAYLQHPQAEPQKATEARRLLDEISLVNSPQRQSEVLTRLSDGDLANLRDGGSWPDGGLPQDPKLREMFIRNAEPLVQREWDQRRPPEKMFHLGQAVKNKGLELTWRGRISAIGEKTYDVRIEDVLDVRHGFREGELHTFDQTQLQAEDRAPQP